MKGIVSHRQEIGPEASEVLDAAVRLVELSVLRKSSPSAVYLDRSTGIACHMPASKPVAHRLRTAATLVIALAAATLTATGCGTTASKTSSSAAPTTKVAAVSRAGQQIGKLSTPGTPKGGQTVKVEVVADKGPKRSAMALVPVYIDGHGPYPFALDTGASSSLIPASLARKLKLPEVGSPETVSGITGSSQAVRVRVGNWRAGSVSLPPTLLSAMADSEPTATAEEGRHGTRPPNAPVHRVAGPVGLLGSDVMSRYGKIAVDYDKGLLILDPPVR